MPEPTRWRKKPVTIEAMQWDGTPDGAAPILAWIRAHDGGVAYFHNECGGGDSHLLIRTLEGDMTARPGDWIVKGVKGEVYPVRADIFADTYEPAEEFVDWGSNDDEVSQPLGFWDTLRWLVLGR